MSGAGWKMFKLQLIMWDRVGDRDDNDIDDICR